MTDESAGIGLEGVGQQAARACGDVSRVDSAHALGTGQVPCLAALAGLQAGLVQLTAHGPIHEQHSTRLQGGQQW